MRLHLAGRGVIPYCRSALEHGYWPSHFPTDDMDFELIIQPPLGRGMVRAFVTPTPLDVPLEGEFTAGDERLAAAIAEAVARAAGTVNGAVRLDSWATASLVYDIRR